jgi:hypothetical protein
MVKFSAGFEAVSHAPAHSLPLPIMEHRVKSKLIDLPTYWLPKQVAAVFEFLDELNDRVLGHYGTQIHEFLRDDCVRTTSFTHSDIDESDVSVSHHQVSTGVSSKRICNAGCCARLGRVICALVQRRAQTQRHLLCVSPSAPHRRRRHHSCGPPCAVQDSKRSQPGSLVTQYA